jgi:hypothetical protein
VAVEGLEKLTRVPSQFNQSGVLEHELGLGLIQEKDLPQEHFSLFRAPRTFSLETLISIFRYSDVEHRNDFQIQLKRVSNCFDHTERQVEAIGCQTLQCIRIC